MTRASLLESVGAGRILDRGVTVSVGSSGVIDPTSLPSRHIPGRWTSAVDEAVEAVIDLPQVRGTGAVRAIYVRGSVAGDAVIPGVSDLDLVVYATSPSAVDTISSARRSIFDSIAARHGFTRVDCAVFLDSRSEGASGDRLPYEVVIQAFGVCVYGDDFIANIPPRRMEKLSAANIVEDFRVASEQAELSANVDDQRRIMQWFFKRALRAAAEVCSTRAGLYSRDLVPCVCQRISLLR